MIENQKRYRPHTSHNLDVSKLIVISYFVVCLMMILPYAKYLSWVLPLLLLLWEKESDFVLFAEAQLLAVSAAHGLVMLVLDWPVQMLIRYLTRSISFGLALLGDFSAFLTMILTAVVTFIPIICLVLTALRAGRYIQASIWLAGRAADKLLTLPRFR